MSSSVVMVRFDFTYTLRSQRPDLGLTWYKSNVSCIHPYAVHLTFPVMHIISHRIYHFYRFKVHECRRKLYGTDVYHQLMSKFRVTLTDVKWMKPTAWKLMLTHLNFLVNKLLLYIQSSKPEAFCFLCLSIISALLFFIFDL